MTRLALTIHDAGLVARRDDGFEDADSGPGYALEDHGELLLGHQALARARLVPRRVQHRFWDELDTDALPRPFSPDLSRADLAHAQLAALWERAGDGVESVALSAPGSYDERQLGLLLAVARACGMPVEGLVDSAVAGAVGAAREIPPAGQILHLDVHLHRAVLSELRIEAGTGGVRWIACQRVEIEPGVGLVGLRDAWARRAASRFVAVTRFDPLHAGTAEQELYDRLPEWLAELATAQTVEARLGQPGKERKVELERDEFVAVAGSFYDRLFELARGVKKAGRPAALLLSSSAAELPGLRERFAGWRDVTLVGLPRDAAVRGLLWAWSSLPEPGEILPFVVRLPWPPAAGAVEARATDSPADRAVPTHVVHGGLARALDERALAVGSEPRSGEHSSGERSMRLAAAVGVSRRHLSLLRRGGKIFVKDHSRYGTWLNGEPVDGGAVLRPGDRLRLGENAEEAPELLLIAVVGDGENGSEEAEDGAAP